MIGFVVDGKVTQCIQRVAGFLTISQRRTQIVEDWVKETSFGNHEHLYRTCHHQRGKKSPITVLHLFLNVQPFSS